MKRGRCGCIAQPRPIDEEVPVTAFARLIASAGQALLAGCGGAAPGDAPIADAGVAPALAATTAASAPAFEFAASGAPPTVAGIARPAAASADDGAPAGSDVVENVRAAETLGATTSALPRIDSSGRIAAESAHPG